jgi:hypothetical protein
MSDLPLSVSEARAILYVDEHLGPAHPAHREDGQYAAWLAIVASAKKRVGLWDRSEPVRCPACAVDPDPRGFSACFACRRLNGW